MNLQEIEAKIDNAPDLDFGTIFSESIELFKKSVVHGFVMQIVLMVISLPLIMVVYLPMVTSIMAQQEMQEYNPDEFNPLLAGLSVGTMILFFIGVLVVAVITIAIRAGFIRMLRDLDEGGAVETKQLFQFFKGQYLGKIFVLMLVILVISLLAGLLCGLPLIYAFVPITFITYFFAYNPEMNVGDIVKLSFKLGTKKWLISFGLLIVAGLLASIIGFLLCGIGTLFTAPFVYHPLYFVYKNTVGFDRRTMVESSI